MTKPKLRLGKLRELGWSIWDPLNLLEPGDEWSETTFADEYDQYLIQAAGRLRREEATNKVVAYIVAVERDVMGLSPSVASNDRAYKLVTAIQQSEDLWSSQIRA